MDVKKIPDEVPAAPSLRPITVLLLLIGALLLLGLLSALVKVFLLS